MSGLFGEVPNAFLPSFFLLVLRGPFQIGTASGFYRLDVSDLLIVTDDMALPPGKIRLRSKGGNGGHNGLADVIVKLGTENFSRLRVGIGSSGAEASENYVLSKPPESERVLLDEAIDVAREAVLCWAEFGIEAAMNKFNE